MNQQERQAMLEAEDAIQRMGVQADDGSRLGTALGKLQAALAQAEPASTEGGAIERRNLEQTAMVPVARQMWDQMREELPKLRARVAELEAKAPASTEAGSAELREALDKVRAEAVARYIVSEVDMMVDADSIAKAWVKERSFSAHGIGPEDTVALKGPQPAPATGTDNKETR